MNTKNFICFVCIVFMVLFLINASLLISFTLSGLTVFYRHVLPVLFPFLFLSYILCNYMPKKHAAFNCFFLGIACGYPVGIKTICQFYQSGKITKAQAKHLASYCCNAGMIFVFGAVATSMLNSNIAGIIITASILISCISNYFIFKPKKLNSYCLTSITNTKNHARFDSVVTDAIYSSTKTILIIGANITLFFIVISCIGSIAFLPEFVLLPLSGLIELTTGASLASNLTNLPIAISLCCFFCCFGGLCTSMQSMPFLQQCNISYSYYIKAKALQALVSFIFCYLLCLLFI